MSMLGKVLIVFNLLAAGAFAYFTLENYKARQELTWAEFRNQVILDGLPVESGPAPKDTERVAFAYQMKPGLIFTEIDRKQLTQLVPAGGSLLGAEAVGDQTSEVVRLKAKVMAGLPGIDVNGGRDRLDGLLKYLRNLARTGAERDGVNALLDYFDNNKKGAARRDLALLARTSSQVEALKALAEVVDLGDPQAEANEATRQSRITNARKAIGRFALGEVSHGASGTDADELRRVLTNLLTTPNEGGKQPVKDAAKADPAGFTLIADAAASPLTDKASADTAARALTAYAVGRATGGTAETNALTQIATLINPPAANFNAVTTVDSAMTELLNLKFDDAAAALPTGRTGKDSTLGKTRKIAHLLYHIDADRHLLADAAADRKAWHERVAVVVGLPEYVRVAEAQASEYAEAGDRLISAITDEETTFRDQYQAAEQRARSLQSRYEALDSELKDQQAITAENVRLKNERETERDALKKDLLKAQEDAKTALDKLKNTQARHFTITKQLRDAQEAILQLEQELRKRELGK